MRKESRESYLFSHLSFAPAAVEADGSAEQERCLAETWHAPPKTEVEIGSDLIIPSDAARHVPCCAAADAVFGWITGLMRTDNQDDGGTLHTSARRALEPTHMGSSRKEKAASHKRIVASEGQSPLSVTASSSPQRRLLPIAALIGNLTTWHVTFVIPGAFSIAAGRRPVGRFPVPWVGREGSASTSSVLRPKGF